MQMNLIKYIAVSMLLLTNIYACKDKEPDPTPIPKISIGDFTFNEGNGTTQFEFQVTLSTTFDESVSVSYKTEEGTAKAGDDFVGVSNGTVTIPAGAFSANILIDIVTDTWKESDESFTVLIFNPVNAVLDDSEGAGLIKNDDTQIQIDDTGYSTPLSYAGYNLVWQDEFSASTLNQNDWTYEIGDGCPNLCGWGNNESQYYTNSTSNCYLTDGKLVIEAKNESFGGRNYTSTRIITKDKQHFKYGRIDIRAKMPEGQGIWPALWLLPNDNVFGGWPASGEIDIMELVGHQPNRTHGTCHFGPDPGNRQLSGNSYSLSSGKFIDEFHVFSIIWEEDKIEWYLDDVKYHEFTLASAGAFNYPFNESFFFIFNIAVGGDWPGQPDNTTNFPQLMLVDYVRVFQVQ